MRKTPLTSYSGGELSPSFSPDGRQVAFSWNGENRDNFDIYVKMTEGGEALRLTRDPQPDGVPAWSPDGRFIAFKRGAAIYLISPLGGAERKVADSRTGMIAWAPDGKSIAISEGLYPQSGALVILNLTTGERRKLTSPPASSGGDESFAFSPNGKHLAFVRRTSQTGSGELYVMPFPNGASKRVQLANDFLYTIAWAPDGRDVLATVERGGTTALWRVPVESGEPSRIGGLDDGARFPQVSAASHRLAYSRLISDENIWSSSGATKTQLIASTRRDFNPQFSPDAGKIAFISDRTGGWEIYVSDARGGHVVQLTSFGSLVVDGVRWSPDGRELVFAVLKNTNRDIYVIPAEGGAPRQITTETSDEGRPGFSMDGKWIYLRSNRSGKDEIWKMSRGGGPATQVTQGGGFEAIETWDGDTLYFVRGRAQAGLWSMPPSGGPAQAVAGLEKVRPGMWGVTQDGVCYIETSPQQKDMPIICWSPSGRKASQIALVDKPLFTAPPVFSVSRDGRHVLWNQTDHLDADLVLVENFR